jgi:hypothetical protein
VSSAFWSASRGGAQSKPKAADAGCGCGPAEEKKTDAAPAAAAAASSCCGPKATEVAPAPEEVRV